MTPKDIVVGTIFIHLILIVYGTIIIVKLDEILIALKNKEPKP